jgi:flavin reductase (DIM6/NTAB) family NADH-FMN oxidoreductase RutF
MVRYNIIHQAEGFASSTLARDYQDKMALRFNGMKPEVNALVIEDVNAKIVLQELF